MYYHNSKIRKIYFENSFFQSPDLISLKISCIILSNEKTVQPYHHCIDCIRDPFRNVRNNDPKLAAKIKKITSILSPVCGDESLATFLIKAPYSSNITLKIGQECARNILVM